MAPNDVNQRDLRRDISYIKKKMFVTIEKKSLVCGSLSPQVFVPTP